MRADDGCLAKTGAAIGSEFGDVSADDQALAGERGGGRDELGEREPSRAVFAPRELEPGDGPRDADREAAISRFERIGLAVSVEKDVLGRR